MKSIPTRKDRQKKIKEERRKSYKRRIYYVILKSIKFLLINIILSFIISVIAFDFVSSEYDTLQVKEEILKDNITITTTEVHGIDGEDIPFSIEFIDFEVVKVNGQNTGFLNIRLRVIQNIYRNDSLNVLFDNQLFDNLDDIQFRIREKRERPTKMQLRLSLRESSEIVGFATFDINQNFMRSIEEKLEVNAKSRFSKFVHSITNKLSELL